MYEINESSIEVICGRVVWNIITELLGEVLRLFREGKLTTLGIIEQLLSYSERNRVTSYKHNLDLGAQIKVPLHDRPFRRRDPDTSK
jgi:hypothetical protein